MLNAIKISDHETIQPKDILLDKMATGFLYHPENTPLKVKRLWRVPELNRDEEKSGESTLGLCFTSQKHYVAGSSLELTISIHGEDHKFSGQIVLIKENLQGYNVGVWLRSQMDACRARIVEQVCYIDSYLEDQPDRNILPFNQEQRIREWISQNAAQIPV